jgi:hypothetical protein
MRTVECVLEPRVVQNPKTLRCRFEAGFLEFKEQRAEEEKEEELVKREEGGPGHRGEGKRISEHEQEGLRGQPAACTKSPGDKIGEEAHSSNVGSVRMSRRSSSQQPGLSFPLACCRGATERATGIEWGARALR